MFYVVKVKVDSKPTRTLSLPYKHTVNKNKSKKSSSNMVSLEKSSV